MAKKAYYDEGLEELRIEICRMAFLDYKTGIRHEKKYRKKIEAIKARQRMGKKLTNAETLSLLRYEERARYRKDAEAFFLSEWGEALTGADGTAMLREANKFV